MNANKYIHGVQSNTQTICNDVSNISKKFFYNNKDHGKLLGTIKTPIKILNVYIQ